LASLFVISEKLANRAPDERGRHADDGARDEALRLLVIHIS